MISASKHRIKEKTLFILDPSDIAKPYARKMQYQAGIRDGITGGLADGYHLCHVIGCECGENAVTPLVNHLWSQKAPDFKSENDEILYCVDQVREQIPEQGIWVIDRGADRIRILEPLLRCKSDFIIRMIGNRNVVYKGKTMLANEAALRVKTKMSKRLRKRIQEPGKPEEFFDLSFDSILITLPKHPKKRLWLIVVKGFG